MVGSRDALTPVLDENCSPKPDMTRRVRRSPPGLIPHSTSRRLLGVCEMSREKGLKGIGGEEKLQVTWSPSHVLLGDG